MKIPDHITIGGHQFKVLLNYKFTQTDTLSGQTDFQAHEIRIACAGQSVNFPRSRVEQIFFHELLHVIDYVYNGLKVEEDTIERMSQGLYQALKVNDMLKEGIA